MDTFDRAPSSSHSAFQESSSISDANPRQAPVKTHEARIKTLQVIAKKPSCPLLISPCREARDRKAGLVMIGARFEWESPAKKHKGGEFSLQMALDEVERHFLSGEDRPWEPIHRVFRAEVHSLSADAMEMALDQKPLWISKEDVIESVEFAVLRGHLPWTPVQAVAWICGQSTDDSLKEVLQEGWTLEIPLADEDRTWTLKVKPGPEAVAEGLWAQKKAKTAKQAHARYEAQTSALYVDGYEQWRLAAIKKMSQKVQQPPNVSPEHWSSLCALIRLEVGSNLLTCKGEWEQQLDVSLNSLVQRLNASQESIRMEAAALEARASLPQQLKDFYPLARGMKRRLRLIMGPTNSGKTHAAMERLMAAQSGTYLGPLRLLALEVRDRLNEAGHPTSLVTGELIEKKEGAALTASTIEMLDFQSSVEVAVIDEVQMLSDPQRGGVWLQAVLGAPAQEVWMLGSPECKEIVQRIASELGEPLEIIEKERLTPLTIDRKHTRLGDLEPGSAVIVFSRREALAMASILRDKFKRKVAVIYGGLSPEVRKQQAQSFRTGDCDLLVSTDAIGMGLNLPISTVIFTTEKKWDGKDLSEIDPHLLWQIAGRAGRYGQFEEGRVGASNPQTLAHIQKVMSHRPIPHRKPLQFEASTPIVETIARAIDSNKLSKILQFFLGRFKHIQSHRPHVSDDAMSLAHVLDRFNLTLQERFALVHAPVSFRMGEPDDFFYQCAQAISQNKPLRLNDMKPLGGRDRGMLEKCESAVKRLNLYAWMHNRFPALFPDMEKTQKAIQKLEADISELLKKLPPPNRWK